MAIIYAMSDIHDYYDLMLENLRLIDLKNKDNKLILLVDYIDYGTDSSKVLYKIKELMKEYPTQVIALKGNHETLFLEFLEAKDFDVWGLEWLGADKAFSTTSTFLSEYIKNKIKKIEEGSKNTMEDSFQIAKLIKEDIKRSHKDLTSWLKGLPLYHEEQKQIFIHADIDEEAGNWWQHGTSEDIFVSKYPATALVPSIRI